MKYQQSVYCLILLAGAISMGTTSAQDLKLYPGKTDVYYSSGNRLPPINRSDLDDFGKKVYDDIIAGGRSFTYDEKNKE